MDELVGSFRTQPLGDERLARLVTAGSDTAFSTLYARYQRPLYRYCRAILRSDADAHDAVQSTLARAFEALRNGRRDAPFRPWIYRIAYNESVNLIRARKSGDELTGHLTPYVARPEDRVHHREQLSSLLEDLQHLPERARGAILMRELAGLSHEEIALALGTSVSAAKQAIFEARTALADYAAGRDMACEKVREAISLRDRRVLRGRRVSAHLRDCPACARFAAELTGRQGRLRAMCAPLPAAAATAVLSRLRRPGPSIGAGAQPAGASLMGGLVNSFSAVTCTIKGALATAALATGMGAAGVQIIRPNGGRASAAVRPASLTGLPASRAQATGPLDGSAAPTPGTARMPAPLSVSGGSHARGSGTGWVRRSPVAAPAAPSGPAVKSPRGPGLSRGHGAGAGHSAKPGLGGGEGYGARRRGPVRVPEGSRQPGNYGYTTGASHVRGATPRGHGNPTSHPGHGTRPLPGAPARRASGSRPNRGAGGHAGGSPHQSPAAVPPIVGAPLKGVAARLPQPPPVAGQL